MIVISNSSPLVYLAALDDFHLLPELFGKILIPGAVFREVVDQAEGLPVRKAVESAAGAWLEVVALKNPPTAGVFRSRGLHEGEAEVIQLAREANACTLLMDDRSAVAHARANGFVVVPTLAIYIRAKRAGIISSVREKADQLRDHRFRLSDPDYLAVLRAAGE